MAKLVSVDEVRPTTMTVDDARPTTMGIVSEFNETWYPITITRGMPLGLLLTLTANEDITFNSIFAP